MSWADLDEDLLGLFGEASHARGFVRGGDAQRASSGRTYDFGELSASRHGALATSKRAQAVERREFKRLYLRKWYREAKADLEKLTRIHASRRKAKAIYLVRLKTNPRLRESVRAYMRAWSVAKREHLRKYRCDYLAENRDRINARRRERASEKRAAGTTMPRKPLTTEQRKRATDRSKAWEAANRERVHEQRKVAYYRDVEKTRARKREDARRRYEAKRKLHPRAA